MCSLQLVDGRCRLLAVRLLSPRADLSIFRRTLVSCQQTVTARCLLQYALPGTGIMFCITTFLAMTAGCKCWIIVARVGLPVQTMVRSCAISSCFGGCTHTTLSRTPLTLCRQCLFTFPGRFAEPWRACTSSTLQVSKRQTWIYNASGLCTLCFCCIVQRLDVFPWTCMMHSQQRIIRHCTGKQTGNLPYLKGPMLQYQQHYLGFDSGVIRHKTCVVCELSCHLC